MNQSKIALNGYMSICYMLIVFLVEIFIDSAGGILYLDKL